MHILFSVVGLHTEILSFLNHHGIVMNDNMVNAMVNACDNTNKNIMNSIAPVSLKNNETQW